MAPDKHGINREAKSDMSDQYTVGYKRPPRAYQWKPGQSGNPQGRPRGSKNKPKHPFFDTSFERTLKVLAKKNKRKLMKEQLSGGDQGPWGGGLGRLFR